MNDLRGMVLLGNRMPQVILQVSEERLQSISRLGYLWVIYEFKHVWDCPICMQICLSYIFMGIASFSGWRNGSFLDKLLVFFMPFVEFHYPPARVVTCLYMAYLTYEPSQCDAG